MNWQDIKDFSAERKKEVGKVVRLTHSCKIASTSSLLLNQEQFFYLDEAVTGLLLFLLYTERP